MVVEGMLVVVERQPLPLPPPLLPPPPNRAYQLLKDGKYVGEGPTPAGEHSTPRPGHYYQHQAWAYSSVCVRVCVCVGRVSPPPTKPQAPRRTQVDSGRPTGWGGDTAPHPRILFLDCRLAGRPLPSCAPIPKRAHSAAGAGDMGASRGTFYEYPFGAQYNRDPRSSLPPSVHVSLCLGPKVDRTSGVPPSLSLPLHLPAPCQQWRIPIHSGGDCCRHQTLRPFSQPGSGCNTNTFPPWFPLFLLAL